MLDRTKVVAERQFLWNDAPIERGSKLDLEGNQIHLWMVDVRELAESQVGSRSATQHNALHNVPDNVPHNFPHNVPEGLSASEHARARTIANHAHRKLYLGGRTGLRILLSSYTGIANTELEFGYGSRGKPRLLNTVSGGRLEFNYTLSNDYALYAFARNREVGVDLEIFPRTIAVNRLANRILTETEKTHWNTVHHQQQNQAMLACWTRKEAYGKVLGVGIRYTMKQVDVFTDLERDCWRTRIAGLFDRQSPKQPPKHYQHLSGVQLGLPVPGVGSLMYADSHEASNEEPELSAFQLSAL